VLGNYLEECHEKRYFLEFYANTVLQALRSPINVLEVNITRFFREAHQAVRFQRRVENTALAMNIFQICNTCIPRVKQYVFCTNMPHFKRLFEHRKKKIVFCGTFIFWRVNTIINWIILAIARTMDEIDNINATNDGVLVAAIMRVD